MSAAVRTLNSGSHPCALPKSGNEIVVAQLEPFERSTVVPGGPNETMSFLPSPLTSATSCGAATDPPCGGASAQRVDARNDWSLAGGGGGSAATVGRGAATSPPANVSASPAAVEPSPPGSTLHPT